MRSADWYAALLQRAPLGIVELSRDLDIVAWNGAAERLLGFAPGEAIGRRIDALVAARGDAAAWRRLLEEDAGEPRIWAHVRKDGGETHCEWLHERIVDEQGEVTGVVCFGRDVTARVQKEARHALEEHLLRTIVESLPVSCWAVDEEGTFLYYDGAALKVLGLAPGWALGQNVFELYAGQDMTALRQALDGEASHNVAEGNGRTWETWFMPVRSGGETTMAAACVSIDITESRRREQDLQDKLALIEVQQRVIRDLSTPILQVWDGVLALPMIGVVDSARTAEVMDSLLEAVVRTQARCTILDLTGVETVDTQTANYIIKLIRALQLLGAEGIITGIRPTVAQTVVSLGLDLQNLITLSNLQAGLKHSILRQQRSAPAGEQGKTIRGAQGQSAARPR
ncbi:PAS domain S-box protein [Sorangium sp. So ce887]|uniref:PAS domain S-box protein n=1 Tax=Sorangium sp. So ce887 TaxID=3133324 RepID=UPI003F6306EA